MLSWLKAHIPQLLVIALSVLVAAGLHFGKLTTDQAIGIGAVLAGIGIHLPAIVYRVPPVIGAMLTAFGLFLVGAFALSVLMLACGAVAKVEYGAQLQACVDKAQNRAEADSCIKSIQLEWTEAGAKPALVFVPPDAAQPADGGGQ
jgi:hypothetical protein